MSDDRIVAVQKSYPVFESFSIYVVSSCSGLDIISNVSHADQGWWIVEVQIVEQPEVDKAEHGGVEFNEDGHEAHVDVLGLVVSEAMRHDPGHDLAHDLGLKV